MAGQTFAYLCVSKVDQNLEQMKMDILKLANAQRLGHVEFVEEQVLGKVTWRKRQIAQVLENCHPGDSIIVSALSRLERSMLECLEILSLTTEKEIHIYAVKGNWCLDGNIQGKIMGMAFAIAIEIEHDMISTRTTEALRVRKEQGMTLGRPKGIGKSKLDQYRTEIEALLKNGSTKTWVAKTYQTTISNLSRWMQQRGIEGR
jgi:DNA invertase Pin-like site-specific DNA recombinase